MGSIYQKKLLRTKDFDIQIPYIQKMESFLLCLCKILLSPVIFITPIIEGINFAKFVKDMFCFLLHFIDGTYPKNSYTVESFLFIPYWTNIVDCNTQRKSALDESSLLITFG